MPPYLIVIATCWIFAASLGGKTNDGFYYLLFIQNLVMWNNDGQLVIDFPWGATHTWSMAVEQQFYLVAPFLVFFLPRKWLFSALWVVVGGSILFKTLWVMQDGGVLCHPRAVHTLSNIDGFAVGGLIGLTLQRVQPGVLLKRLAPWFIAGLVAYIVVGVSMDLTWFWYPRFVGGGTMDWYIGYLMALILWASILLLASAERTARWLRPVLSWQPLRYLGRISYGIYIYHLLIFFILFKIGLNKQNFEVIWPFELLIVAFVVLVAALSWRFIEVPCSRLRKYFPYHSAESSPEGRPMPGSGSTRLV